MAARDRVGAANVQGRQGMAYDEGLAEIMRGDLAEMDGVTEKKMFGGIAFMLMINQMK